MTHKYRKTPASQWKALEQHSLKHNNQLSEIFDVEKAIRKCWLRNGFDSNMANVYVTRIGRSFFPCSEDFFFFSPFHVWWEDRESWIEIGHGRMGKWMLMRVLICETHKTQNKKTGEKAMNNECDKKFCQLHFDNEHIEFQCSHLSPSLFFLPKLAWSTEKTT